MFLGIDISKDNFDVALLETLPETSPETSPKTTPDTSQKASTIVKGKIAKDKAAKDKDAKPRHKAFPNTPHGFERLQEWLAGHTVHACLEATGIYGDALARFLQEHDHIVSVVNPAQIKAFGQTGLSRTKTDKADAILIARYCRMHRPEPWKPPTVEADTLQALVRRLESLKEMQQMERNRLDVSPVPVRVSIEAVLSVLAEQIQSTTQAIQDHINDDDTLSDQRALLVSIPGISHATAAAILSSLRDVRHFAGPRQVVAFAGLAPRIRQSGSSVRGRSALSKNGDSHLRRALYFPAMVAIRCNPAIKAMSERMTAAGKIKMVILGAAMRKLLQIAVGVLKSGKAFDPQICQAKKCQFVAANA